MATTVFINLRDIFASGFARTVEFYPLDAPYIEGQALVAGERRSITTDDEGKASVMLEPGNYRVEFVAGINRDVLKIGVPGDGAEYPFTALINEGATIPNPPVYPGARGKSAYEVALDNGFLGTEEEWLESLVGPVGDQGPPGIRGEKGDVGPVGDTGPRGEQGIQGEKGDKGDSGEQGEMGSGGEQGPPGISAYQSALNSGFSGTEQDWLDSLVGPQGAEGPQGERGEKGAQGDQGPSGEKGEKGAAGEQGPAATIEIGDVQTVPYETPASVTNTGTEQAAVLGFEIPRGRDAEPDALTIAAASGAVPVELTRFAVVSLSLAGDTTLEQSGVAEPGSICNINVFNPDGHMLSFDAGIAINWCDGDELPSVPPDGCIVSLVWRGAGEWKGAWRS